MLLNILGIIAFAVVFGTVGYIAWVMYADFRDTPAEQRGTLSQIFRLGAGSAVKAFNRIVAIVAGVLQGLTWLPDVLNMPQVSDAINRYLPAQRVTAVMLGIALLTLVLRSRTTTDRSWL